MQSTKTNSRKPINKLIIVNNHFLIDFERISRSIEIDSNNFFLCQCYRFYRFHHLSLCLQVLKVSHYFTVHNISNYADVLCFKWWSWFFSDIFIRFYSHVTSLALIMLLQYDFSRSKGLADKLYVHWSVSSPLEL